MPSDMAAVQLCRSAIAKGQQLGLKDEVKEAQRVLAEEEAGRNVFGHLYLGMMRYDPSYGQGCLCFCFLLSLSLAPKRRRAAATDAYQERHDMELWIDLG